jgi:hypothetical protein
VLAEAQNVLVDAVAELSFYVRLRLGHSEVGRQLSRNSIEACLPLPRTQTGSTCELQVTTDVMRDCISPKFLKDVRMDVPNAEGDVLRVCALLFCFA